VTNSVFIICEIILAIFFEARKRFRTQTTEQKRSEKFTILLSLLAVIDYIKCLISVEMRWTNKFLLFPWIASFVRPWILIITITFLRNYWRKYWNVMKATFTMVIVILSFVLFWAFVGMRIFAGTVQGTSSFSNLNLSFWNMFVLLTTANFPDIMLPSYNERRYMCLFFIFFLVFGLWLLMNLFLAIFYSRFQGETDQFIDDAELQRNDFFSEFFHENSQKVIVDKELAFMLDRKSVL